MKLSTVKPRCGNCGNKASAHTCGITIDDKTITVIDKDPCHHNPSRFMPKQTKIKIPAKKENTVNGNGNGNSNGNGNGKKRAPTTRVSREKPILVTRR
jgi:hypothetical protein